MKINPYYTRDYIYSYGRAHYTLGNTERAINALEKTQLQNKSTMPIALPEIKTQQLDEHGVNE